MNKIRAIFILLTLSCFHLAAFANPGPSHPNILLIMVDDMGFSDLGCYGSEIPTPNIDALADHGVRFSQFKNTSRCCPSRAALLTGRHQHAVDMGWMTAVDEHRPGYRGQIPNKIPTIAEIFKLNGYSTYMSGKWHVTVDGGWSSPDAKPNGSWPTERGFDRYYGSLAGGGNYYQPKGLTVQEKRINEFPDDYYYTSAITENAVNFIQEHNTDNPMFFYLAHYAPHRPLQAPKEMVDANREKYSVGYDVLKEKRYANLKKQGLIHTGFDLPIHQTEYDGKRPTWNDLDQKSQEKWITEMATFSAMIEVMDDGIGQVVDVLKKKGMYENTIILFLSDNGATNEGGKISQLAADLSNTPYRSYKAYTYLGGISSPLIIHYPKKYAKLNGTVKADQAHITDILPTCVELAGLKYPGKFNGSSIPETDGKSMAKILAGKKRKQCDYFFEHQGSCSILSGKWRLVKNSVDKDWRLFNLDTDPFEQKDIASQHPEKAKQLEIKWMRWANNNKVLPLESKPWNERIKYYKKLNPDQDGIE